MKQNHEEVSEDQELSEELHPVRGDQFVDNKALREFNFLYLSMEQSPWETHNHLGVKKLNKNERFINASTPFIPTYI